VAGRWIISFLVITTYIPNMKTIIPITAFIFSLSCSTTALSQEESISMKAVAPAITFHQIPVEQVTDSKINVSNFLQGSPTEQPFVKINCHAPVMINVKIFVSSGDLVQTEAHFINERENDLQLNIDELPTGVYFVQFYTDVDSALRRLIK
jgi:hypothetical protein